MSSLSLLCVVVWVKNRFLGTFTSFDGVSWVKNRFLGTFTSFDGVSWVKNRFLGTFTSFDGASVSFLISLHVGWRAYIDPNSNSR